MNILPQVIHFQGGFARCYEVRDAQTNEIFACKVVSKSLLMKQHQREKMAQVLNIQKLGRLLAIPKLYQFKFVYFIISIRRSAFTGI